MKGVIRYLVLGLTIILLPFTANAQGNGWEESFFKANQAYKDGQFDAAVEGYEALIGSGHAGGDLFFNLGNAYFRQDKLGWAILNYKINNLFITYTSSSL